MSLVLKVACPTCGFHSDSMIGSEIRCDQCGNDFRAFGHGESSSRIISVTPDELEHIPYSQRSTAVPRSSASSQIISDPALLDDLLLRDLPLRDNARWAGRVRMIKKLGHGGMGAVYRGYDESLCLDVAVKILPIPPGGREMHFADRFRQEARISAQINSPNVVRTRDVGENGTLVYLVMDFIDGMTARQLLERKGLIPVPQALQIIHDASLGMQAAHERGIVHRDVKPENILVANDGRVLLADLGLAKASSGRVSDSMMPVTRMGLLLGTPEYMSPEQWDIGSHITPRSDIWSMGVTLWLLLTRHAPFEDSDLGQLAKKIKEAPLPDIHTIRPDVPEKVAAILYHCMAKNPQRRYMNSAALVSALSNAMMHPEQTDDEFSIPPLTQSSLSIARTPDSLEAARTEVRASPSKVLVPAAKVATPIPAVAAQVQKVAPASKVVPIKSAIPAYVEPPRAMPTPIHAPPKRKSEVILRRKKTTTTRKLAWISGAAAAACVAFAVYHYSGFGPGSVSTGKNLAANVAASNDPKTSVPAKSLEPEVALEITSPQRVKVGEKAVLAAEIKGVDDPSKFEIVWTSGKDLPQTGANIAAQFEADKDYDVTVTRIDGAKKVATKHVRVEVDLAVLAIEGTGNDQAGPKRLEAAISGGAGLDKTEVRWFDIKNPNEILSNKNVFELPTEKAKPGSYVYVCQARRKGARDWSSAASDKLPVIFQAAVPAEFTQAVKDAEKFMKEAEAAETGTAAQLALKDALECFDNAQRIMPDNGDVQHRKQEAQRREKAEMNYAKLLNESRESFYQAEANGSDPFEKLKALDSALKPCSAAETYLKANELQVHPELKAEIKRIESAIVACRETIGQAKKKQTEFDGRVTKARSYVKEAEKYNSLSVALPHWENARDTFATMKKDYPDLASNEGFKLELKKAEEEYNKAFLFVNFGITPARPEDSIYQKQPHSAPTQRGGQQFQTSNKKETGVLIDQ